MTTIMSLTAEEQRKLAFECGAKEVDEYGWDYEIAFSKDAMTAYTAAVEAKERERCAITAWTIGMDEHTKARGMSCDAREVGAIAAREIRRLINE